MKLTFDELTLLKDIACEAALSAGAIIKRFKGRDPGATAKESGSTKASQVVTEADLASQEAILSRILPTLLTFDIALLSEELEDDRSRLIKDYFWAIDPLDGTLPFIEGNDGYSVSISLLARSGTPVMGVVLDPETDTLYSAIKGHGAVCNQKHLHISKIASPHCHLIVDRSLNETVTHSTVRDLFIEKLGKRGVSLVEAASLKGAVLNACDTLAKGPLALYFKPPRNAEGGGCIWDFAASSCIFSEAGGIVTDCYGEPLNLNSSESVYMNRQGVIFATTSEISRMCISSLKQYTADQNLP